jgi:TetR/AcrR family transcriptional repressor of nem operon
VLDRAVEAFWQQGFHGVGTRRLCEVTGINQSSLYNTFGDKDSFFAAALRRYADTVLAPIFEALEDDRDPVDALCTVIGIWETHNAADNSPGCLFTHTLSDIGLRGEGPIQSAATEIADRVSAGLARRLRQAHDVGRLPRGSDPDQLTQVFLIAGLGIATSGRAGVSPAAIGAMAQTLYQLLGQQPEARAGP